MRYFDSGLLLEVEVAAPPRLEAVGLLLEVEHLLVEAEDCPDGRR